MHSYLNQGNEANPTTGPETTNPGWNSTVTSALPLNQVHRASSNLSQVELCEKELKLAVLWICGC